MPVSLKPNNLIIDSSRDLTFPKAKDFSGMSNYIYYVFQNAGTFLIWVFLPACLHHFSIGNFGAKAFLRGCSRKGI